MALALSKSSQEFEKTLSLIRYKDGKISYVSRNHFPCGDWIPNNKQAGFIADITQEVAGPLSLEIATATISKKSWYENLPELVIRVPGISDSQKDILFKELKKEGAAFKAYKSYVPYIPLDKVLIRKEISEEEKIKRTKEEEQYLEIRKSEISTVAASDHADFDLKTHDKLVEMRLQNVLKDTEVDSSFLERIPSGIIFNIVRPNWKIPGSHLNITHQGFIIRKKGIPYVRHVSKTGGGRVKDVLLANYLRLCLLSPPIKGINFLRILEKPQSNH
jgi:hypothetical protein